MDRIKQLLSVAPVVALVVAIAYLQGYWGYYKILVFPYLSFNEMLAYAAAPLFGFLLISSLGMFLGVLKATTKPSQTFSTVREVIEIVLLGSLCVVLVYLDRPEKWLIVPLVVLGFSSSYMLDIQWVRERVKESPNIYFVVLIAVYFVFASFGLGRSEAQSLAQSKTPTVQVLIEGDVINTRLLGKINAYYFFLNAEGKVSQYPEAAIKRIVYEKSFPSGG